MVKSDPFPAENDLVQKFHKRQRLHIALQIVAIFVTFCDHQINNVVVTFVTKNTEIKEKYDTKGNYYQYLISDSWSSVNMSA